MAITAHIYNHTVRRFMDGSNAAGDTYKVNLYSAFTFDATATTKSAAETGATELTTANGYTQFDKTLGSVSISTILTNGAMFDAGDTSWTASGGNIAARYVTIFNDTDTDDPPVVTFDLGETVTALSGDFFELIWNANGIISGTVV